MAFRFRTTLKKKGLSKIRGQSDTRECETSRVYLLSDYL